MRVPRHAHWLATALFAAGLALASQLALAHGGHHHEQPEAAPPAASGQAESGKASAAVAPAVAPGASHSAQAAWSRSCPDGSGGDCCCKHQPVTSGVAKIALVYFNGWFWPASLASRQPDGVPLETLPQQISVSPALPRAPPFFS